MSSDDQVTLAMLLLALALVIVAILLLLESPSIMVHAWTEGWR